MNERERLGWKWILWPLLSRKVQAAIATLIVSWCGAAGVDTSEGQIAWIIGTAATGMAVILGIAHEDAAGHG